MSILQKTAPKRFFCYTYLVFYGLGGVLKRGFLLKGDDLFSKKVGCDVNFLIVVES